MSDEAGGAPAPVDGGGGSEVSEAGPIGEAVIKAPPKPRTPDDDYEDLLMNDGCTGIAVLNPSIPLEVKQSRFYDELPKRLSDIAEGRIHPLQDNLLKVGNDALKRALVRHVVVRHERARWLRGRAPTPPPSSPRRSPTP